MTDLIFVVSQSNKNSIAALCGALDKKSDFGDKFNLRFVDEKNVGEIASNQKQIICFSFQTPDVFRIQPLVGKLKRSNKEAILIAGGSHPSGAYQHTLKMGFDFAFVGEGEKALINFLRGYSLGGGGGKAESVDITKFLPVSKKFRLFTPIEITRGCPHGCRFCQTTYLFGKMRHRTIDQIVESAKILVSHGWTKIRFVTPNILSYGSLEKMLASVRKVKGVKKIYAGSFPSEVRPENADKKGLLVLKKYADNDNLIIGFQSGSENVLKRMHRQHTVKQALEAVEKALEAGFKANLDFIFGTPGETKEEEGKTIDMLKKLARLSGAKIHGHTFLPLPGTPWQNEKPGKISERLKEILRGLKALGRVYGDWENQEKLAQKISGLKW